MTEFFDAKYVQMFAIVESGTKTEAKVAVPSVNDNPEKKGGKPKKTLRWRGNKYT